MGYGHIRILNNGCIVMLLSNMYSYVKLNSDDRFEFEYNALLFLCQMARVHILQHALNHLIRQHEYLIYVPVIL